MNFLTNKKWTKGSRKAAKPQKMDFKWIFPFASLRLCLTWYPLKVDAE
jgi:hypothetical protein